MTNKIWSVGTKFKAHHQVFFFFNKAAATCSSPRCLRRQCFQLYSVSPVHKSTVKMMKKKEKKTTSYISAYTSKDTTGIHHSSPLYPVCATIAPSRLVQWRTNKYQNIPLAVTKSVYSKVTLKWHSHTEHKTLITTILTESNPLQLLI